MLFNSWPFLVYFPLVTVLYFIFPFRYQWSFLLFASCMFYMAFIPAYIFILFALIGIDYACGIWIEQTDPRHKKFFLIISILSTCTALFIFKYFNFFQTTIYHVAQLLHISYAAPLLNLVLPLGLSFHTFQSLSYVIEVYKGKQKAERHLGIYALYVMFYPQLVSGPIERPGQLLPQLKEHHRFDYAKMKDGLKLMLWGFIKKMVIADRLSVLVDSVYGNPHASVGWPMIIATLFFAVQIYCDFSGYTDIAIGAASVMGIDLVENFRRPYLAPSLMDFWHRWHISLSTWFRDYLYIPIGGSQVSQYRFIINILIVFLVSGLWHGANLTFLIWGAIHGLFYLIDRFTGKKMKKIYSWLRLPDFVQYSLGWMATMAAVSFAWIFFRSKSVHDAFFIVKHLFVKATFEGSWNKEVFGMGLKEFMISLGLIGMLFVVEVSQEFLGGVRLYVLKWPQPLRWACSYGLILILILLGEFKAKTFIYFQF